MKKLALLFILALSLPAQVTLTRNMIGSHVSQLAGAVPTPFPSFGGTYRTLGALIKWADVRPCPAANVLSTGQCNITPSYDWTRFDKTITAAVNGGSDWIIVAWYWTPRWMNYSTMTQANAENCLTFSRFTPGSGTTAYQYAGGCGLPSDLATDGSGTDQFWKDSVTDVTAHLMANWPYTHFQIELWNEINGGVSFYFPGYQLLAPLSRMAQDAAPIVHAAHATDNVAYKLLSPPLAGGGNLGTAGACSVNPLTTQSFFLSCLLDATYNSVTLSSVVDGIGTHPYPSNRQSPEDMMAALDNEKAQMGARSLTIPLINTEGSWGLNTNLTDPEAQAGFTWRWLLSSLPYVSASYWYEYDTSGNGTLYDTTNKVFTQAGKAWLELSRQLIGKTISKCLLSGTTYTCAVTKPNSNYVGSVVWSIASGVTCSNSVCPTVTYTPQPLAYTRYTDIYGTVTTIPLNTNIQIGFKPLLLDNMVELPIDFYKYLEQGPQRTLAGYTQQYHVAPWWTFTAICEPVTNSCYSGDYVPSTTDVFRPDPDGLPPGGIQNLVLGISTSGGIPFYVPINIGTNGNAPGHWNIARNTDKVKLTITTPGVMKFYITPSTGGHANTQFYIADPGGTGWPAGVTFTYFIPAGQYSSCFGTVTALSSRSGWGNSIRCVEVNVALTATDASFTAGWSFCSTSNCANTATFSRPMSIEHVPHYNVANPTSIPAMPSIFTSATFNCFQDPGNGNFTQVGGTNCSWQHVLNDTDTVGAEQKGAQFYCSDRTNPDNMLELAASPLYMFFSNTGETLFHTPQNDWYYDGAKIYEYIANWLNNPTWENCSRMILSRYTQFGPGVPGVLPYFANASWPYNTQGTTPFSAAKGWEFFAHGIEFGLGRFNSGVYSSTWVDSQWNAGMAASLYTMLYDDPATNAQSFNHGAGLIIGGERETTYNLNLLLAMRKQLGTPILNANGTETLFGTNYRQTKDNLATLVMQYFNPVAVSQYDYGPVGYQMWMDGGLVTETLREDYELTHDPRDLFLIKLLLDDVYAQYSSSRHSIMYTHEPSPYPNLIVSGRAAGPWCGGLTSNATSYPQYSWYAGTIPNCNEWPYPELDGMVASTAAWWWRNYGGADTTYQVFADELFTYGLGGQYTTAAYRFTAKAFNQFFRFAFDYARLRSGR